MVSPSEIGEVLRLLTDFDLEVKKRRIDPRAVRVGLKLALALNEVELAACKQPLDKVEAEIQPLVAQYMLSCEEG